MKMQRKRGVETEKWSLSTSGRTVDSEHSTARQTKWGGHSRSKGLEVGIKEEL